MSASRPFLPTFLRSARCRVHTLITALCCCVVRFADMNNRTALCLIWTFVNFISGCNTFFNVVLFWDRYVAKKDEAWIATHSRAGRFAAGCYLLCVVSIPISRCLWFSGAFLTDC